MSLQHSWPAVLTALIEKNDLDEASASWAIAEILSGEATPAQIAGFAVALRSKGETVAEVAALVAGLYAQAGPLNLPGRWLDIVGTGGDLSNSVNISTMASIVAAAAGAKVAKHGNRSASSASGSADVLEVLGVRLDAPAADVVDIGESLGITFCFAPAFHPALRHAGPPRRELGVLTTFNFLGPLANPARPQAMAVGCAQFSMAPLMAGVLAARQVDAWVFRGDDGLDELTTTTTSSVWRVADAEVTAFTLDPADLGIRRGDAADLVGGDAAHNAAVIERTLAGEPGAITDAVVLNAGAGLAVYNQPNTDPLEALSAGIAAARQALEDGVAARLLHEWVRASAGTSVP